MQLEDIRQRVLQMYNNQATWSEIAKTAKKEGWKKSTGKPYALGTLKQMVYQGDKRKYSVKATPQSGVDLPQTTKSQSTDAPKFETLAATDLTSYKLNLVSRIMSIPMGNESKKNLIKAIME